MIDNTQSVRDAAFTTISLSILMGFKETPEHVSYCDTLKHLLFDPEFPESNPLLDRDYPVNPFKIERLSTDQIQNIVGIFDCLSTDIALNIDKSCKHKSKYRLAASALADKFRAIENQKEASDLAKYDALNN